MLDNKIVLSCTEIRDQNATPFVVAALQQLNTTGGTLCFTPGTYHFYKDGAHNAFYAVCNNSAGEKAIVFPLLNAAHLTVDGGGAVFVFHDIVMPFAVDGCRDITLKNMTLDRAQAPYARMRVRDVSAKGFGLEIDRTESPFFLEDGILHFLREYGVRSGREHKYALHATKRIRERYLFTGDCTDSTENLPVAYMWGDAEERDWGIYLTYREGLGASPCLYEEGEELFVLLDGNRDVDSFFLQDSEQVCIENITVRHGLGMGIIGQLCRDVTVKGFSTDATGHENGVTICTDAMHFVNCDGRLEISECDISHTGDDGLNVHGVYTRLQDLTDGGMEVALMHQEQFGFCPYRAGDLLSLIDRKTLSRVAEFRVTDAQVNGKDQSRIAVCGEFLSGLDGLAALDEVLVENPLRMPDLHLHHNHFHHYPNLRISGGGAMLVEHNLLECSKSAMVISDLWDYWYESGRVRDLVIRNNRMVGCNRLGTYPAFLQIGVSGFDDATAPKIHNRIEISGNLFADVGQYVLTAGGVSNLTVHDNCYDDSTDARMRIDGKEEAAR